MKRDVVPQECLRIGKRIERLIESDAHDDDDDDGPSRARRPSSPLFPRRLRLDSHEGNELTRMGLPSMPSSEVRGRGKYVSEF